MNKKLFCFIYKKWCCLFYFFLNNVNSAAASATAPRLVPATPMFVAVVACLFLFTSVLSLLVECVRFSSLLSISWCSLDRLCFTLLISDVRSVLAWSRLLLRLFFNSPSFTLTSKTILYSRIKRYKEINDR